MACHGCDVYFADRRGSGLNGHQRGHADDAARLLNDVRQLIRIAREEHPHAGVTLLGLSWGGKLAAAFASRFPEDIDRLALLYPGLKSQFSPNRLQSALLKFAIRRDRKHRPVRLPFQSPELFTSQKNWQQFIQDDPLKLEWLTTGLVNAGVQLDQMLANSEGVMLPTLLCLAGRDQLIDNQQTRRIVCDWPTESLNVRCFPDAQHTLEFEPEREGFVEQLSSFCLGLT